MAANRSLDQQHSIVEAANEYGIILDTREIFLSGAVDENGDLGNRFITNLQILLSKSQTKPIVIHQHSLGGDWACGMMILDAITTCPCPIIFICHGIAASMGTIIPTGCIKHGDSYVISMPNCDWLIHDGYTDIENMTYKQSRHWAIWEKRIRNSMIDWYVETCKANGVFYEDKTEKQIKAHIQKQLNDKEDWWLSSREAVEYGFANAVLGDEGFESIKQIKQHWNE